MWCNGFRIGFAKILFSHKLQKSVETLVHPGPLPFIAVYYHREIVVAHFVNDHAYHPKLGPVANIAVLVGPAVVPANHGILHALIFGTYRNGLGIRIIKGHSRIGI